jgi:hypothetical protein
MFVAAMSAGIWAYFGGSIRLLPNYIYKLAGIEGHEEVILATVAALSLSITTLTLRDYSRVKYRNKILDIHITKYSSDSGYFVLLAQNNAECDRILFDIFFQDLMKGRVAKDALQRAISVADENIEDTIEKAAIIFGAITGGRCAVCVKAVDYDETDENNLRVSTYRRDDFSLNKRRTYDKTAHSVRKNTADVFIFTETNGEYRNKVWANDNLRLAHKNHEYVNERPNWNDDYNATIVCGIENLRVDRKIPWAGLFCIDNKVGGLTSETAEHYARELSYRLSVMLYRTELLRERLGG